MGLFPNRMGPKFFPRPRGVFSRAGRARHSWTLDINEASRVGRLGRLELPERIREALAVPSRSGIRVIAKGVRCIADDVAERRAPNTLRYIPGLRRPGRANLGHDQRHVLGDLHLDQCRFRSQRAPLGVGSPVRRPENP
jgi:hypothetical protein